MPKTVKPFTPDLKQLKRGIEHICYEYANLMSAAHWDMNGSAPWRTHADDAFLLGYRKLGDFLLNPAPFQVEQPRTSRYSRLGLFGYTPNWTLPTWTKEWRDPMNRQLAHLSYIRDKAWVHYDWSEAGEGVPDRLGKVPACHRSQVQEALCYRDHKVSAQAGLRRN
ncbi:MAG: hypothetical protein HYS04_11335 [Acidobacteria bacterium]|nr:hypothetical protein [Acidobacteriota bacterium]